MGRNGWIACVLVSLACWSARAVSPTGEIIRLKGHADAVLAAAISPDGKQVITGSNDHLAIIWDVETGKVVHRLEGHAFGVTSVGFSGDGSRVVTGSLDHTARVWDAKSGELLAILKGVHRMHVHGAAISPDGKRVLTASCDCSVVLWDVATEKPLQQYRHSAEAFAVAFSPDGATFVSGCRSAGGNNEKNLRLYNARTAQPIEDFQTEWADQLSYIEGGKRVIVLGGWSHLASLDVEKRQLTDMDIGQASIHAIGASPDGKQFLVSRVFEPELVEFAPRMRTLKRYAMVTTDVVRVTAISPDGTWGLIAGGGKNEPWGGSVKYYQPATDSDVRIVTVSKDFNSAVYTRDDPRFAETLGGFVCSAEGGKLLTFYRDNSIVWWDGDSGRELARRKWGNSVQAVALSRDGARTLVEEVGGLITCLEGSRTIGTVKDDSDSQVFAMALGADGDSVFAGGWRRQSGPRGGAMEMQIHQYSLKDLREIRTFKGPVGTVSALALSPDGRTLVGLCSNEYGGETAALAWDIASGRELWKWKPETQPKKHMIGPLVIDKAGRGVAFVVQSQAIVLDLASGKAGPKLQPPPRNVKVVGFDPDGKRLWTVSYESAQSWDRESGARISEKSLAMRSEIAVLRFSGGHHRLIEAIGTRVTEQELDP